jgi:hypothetical protein
MCLTSGRRFSAGVIQRASIKASRCVRYVTYIVSIITMRFVDSSDLHGIIKHGHFLFLLLSCFPTFHAHTDNIAWF